MSPILATDLDGTLIPVTPVSPTATNTAAVNGNAVGATADVPSSQPSRDGRDSDRHTVDHERLSKKPSESECHAKRDNVVETSTNESPATDSVARQRAALAKLHCLASEGKLEIIFVTGRHPSSVLEAIRDEGLPVPQWIIGDVGTTILCRGTDQRYQPLEAYVNHLDVIVGDFTTGDLRASLRLTNELRLQEDEKQGRHKLSFYCDALILDDLTKLLNSEIERLQAPYRTIGSVDPFNGDGLIDVLPQGTDKSSALAWWADQRGVAQRQIVFAGDSGNDFAALTAGFRAIVVGNAAPDLRMRVLEHHRSRNTLDRVYLANGWATAGVLEGCIEYGII